MGSVIDFGIIGAGPSGSTLAYYLARAGFSVEVYEKDSFPRFHIGESLLPKAVDICQDMGLNLETRPYAVSKMGARFVNEDSDKQCFFDFNSSMSDGVKTAFHVTRADFDNDLAQVAQDAGARFHFNTSISQLTAKDASVEVVSDKSNVEARYVINSTGQYSRRLGHDLSKQVMKGLGKQGWFFHQNEVPPDVYHQLFSRGEIVVLSSTERYWTWLIPLANYQVSIGTVVHDSSTMNARERFLTQWPNSKILQSLCPEGVPKGSFISDYGYKTQPNLDSRVISLGDAYSFLDPVFSSGVTLAMYTGQQLVTYLDPNLNPQELNLQHYYDKMSSGYRVFEKMIERFYRPHWVENTFFHEYDNPKVTSEITTILAGDVWREDNHFQNQLMNSKRSSIRYVDYV